METNVSKLDFQFMEWLIITKGIDTQEKFDAISEEDYIEYKKMFINDYIHSVAIKV